MKKLFTICFLSAFALGFSQKKFIELSEAELYNMFKNSAAAKNQYSELTEKERKEQFSEYYCMIKKYKRDFSNDSNFTDEETAEKNLNNIFNSPDSVKPETPAVEFMDTMYRLQMGQYEKRIGFYESNKKCLKRENFYW